MEKEKISNKELEYKYRADNVSPTDFEVLMQTLEYSDKIEVSSWDIYYIQKGTTDMFQRYRMSGDKPELTKKRKVKDTDNWERIEVDLPLDPDRVTEKIVKDYVGLDGYKENFRIYKSCFIYWFENVNMVWYSVYDRDMNEKGRFIEVEINKDKVEDLGDGAFEVLKNFEQELAKVNISPKNRLKKSLFEMFVQHGR